MLVIDTSLLSADLIEKAKKTEARTIEVGQFGTKYVGIPDFDKPVKTLANTTIGISGGGQAISGLTLKVRYRSGVDRSKTQQQLAEELDDLYGLFTATELDQFNPNLLEFLHLFWTATEESELRRLKNGCLAWVLQSIYTKQYGNNSRKWADKKGFNMPMVTTGKFIKDMEARFVSATVN